MFSSSSSSGSAHALQPASAAAVQARKSSKASACAVEGQRRMNIRHSLQEVRADGCPSPPAWPWLSPRALVPRRAPACKRPSVNWRCRRPRRADWPPDRRRPPGRDMVARVRDTRACRRSARSRRRVLGAPPAIADGMRLPLPVIGSTLILASACTGSALDRTAPPSPDPPTIPAPFVLQFVGAYTDPQAPVGAIGSLELRRDGSYAAIATGQAAREVGAFVASAPHQLPLALSPALDAGWTATIADYDGNLRAVRDSGTSLYASRHRSRRSGRGTMRRYRWGVAGRRRRRRRHRALLSLPPADVLHPERGRLRAVKRPHPGREGLLQS